MSVNVLDDPNPAAKFFHKLARILPADTKRAMIGYARLTRGDRNRTLSYDVHFNTPTSTDSQPETERTVNFKGGYGSDFGVWCKDLASRTVLPEARPPSNDDGSSSDESDDVEDDDDEEMDDEDDDA